MPSFAFFSDFTTAQTLASGEFGFIDQEGSLEVDGDAITSTGDVLISVNGFLAATSNAVAHDSNGVFLMSIGESGRVRSNNADAIFVEESDRAFIRNDGRIVSAFDAIDVDSGGQLTVVNNGTLVGESDGLVTDATGGSARIVNNGVIDGLDGGIDHVGGESLLINRGQIREAENYGFSGDEGRDEVRNTGTILGGVFLEAGDDVVTNQGVIDRVVLGIGDDVYIGRGRGSAGRVDGRDGEDFLIGSRADDVFAGGTGADTFLFGRRGGDDRILDFAGADRIVLTDFGLSGFSDLRPLIEERPNGVLIDLSDDGLTILLADVEKADLRANDFVFELLMT